MIFFGVPDLLASLSALLVPTARKCKLPAWSSLKIWGEKQMARKREKRDREIRDTLGSFQFLCQAAIRADTDPQDNKKKKKRKKDDTG